MRDPEKFNVRVLAQRHGLSIARVDAILRLKGLEEQWRKVSYAFCKGTTLQRHGMISKSISL